MPAVSVEGLTKRYGDNLAVDANSFSYDQGEVFALLGPNGAGKTTTVEILEGMGQRDSGTVEVLGHDPARRNQEMRDRLGIVLQELAVEPLLSVREVLQRNAGYYPNPRGVAEVIELVGLGEKSNARVKTLSGGQQRRLDLGLGIIGNPELIFLDEPTTGFPRPVGSAVVRGSSSSRCAQQGTTVVLTAHYMDEADALADRVAIIRRRVASSPRGPPGPLGGRDPLASSASGFASTFPGRDMAHCPLPTQRATSAGSNSKSRPHDETNVLHTLTGWSLDSQDASPSAFAVERLTLEDVYLSLTSDGKRRENLGDLFMTASVADNCGDAERRLGLVARQVRYEQLAFWRNRFGAWSSRSCSRCLFLVLLAAWRRRDGLLKTLGGIPRGSSTTSLASPPTASCRPAFPRSALQMVVRREDRTAETGCDFRPLPTWVLFAGIFISSAIVALAQVVVLLVIARYGYHAVLPHNLGAFAIAMIAGVLCFSSLGIAISTVVPEPRLGRGR